MRFTFDGRFEDGGRRVSVSIPASIHRRRVSLREQFERRFRMQIDEDGLVGYFCLKAIEAMEEWEMRSRR